MGHAAKASGRLVWRVGRRGAVQHAALGVGFDVVLIVMIVVLDWRDAPLSTGCPAGSDRMSWPIDVRTCCRRAATFTRVAGGEHALVDLVEAGSGRP
jgi:hypothetical protein